MKHAQIAWTNEQAARFLSGGVRFFLAGALTAARLSGGAAPFALGFTAACGPGIDGLCALAGAVVGALAFLDFSSGLAHIAAAILIFTTASAFREMKISRGALFPALTSAGLFLAVQGIYVLQSLNPMTRLAPCLIAATLTGASAWGYGPLLGRGEESKKPNALLFLSGSLLLAFTDVEIAGISIGRVAIACLVLFAAWQRGTAAGATLGICTGLLVDLSTGGGLLFTAIYGFSALAAGVRTRRSRVSAALIWLLATLAVLVPVTDPRGIAALEEALLAVPLFLLIPRRAMGGKRVQQDLPPDPAALVTLKSRLDRAAAAFRDLYDSMGRSTAQVTDENPAIIFDRSAERVCRSCALCDLCWKKDYNTTFNALNDATPFLLERGRALSKDFPNHFSSRCIHLPDFLEAINAELSAFLLRKQYRRALEETRRSAKGQYAQLSDLLSATAANLEAAPAMGEDRSYRIGAALKPKPGETICGDSVTSFRTDGGLLCLLLSDGMGSGEAARRESALTCRLVQQFLEAGVGAEAALKTMNTALALRGQETNSFSTIDLLTVQLADGQASLYKYGAAPTYIKRFGSVRRITGSTLPAGLRPTPGAPDITHLLLEPDSFVVMISDGVADSSHDEWLQNLLSGWDGSDPQALAGLILSAAAQQGTLEDDCGVQVLCLPSENSKKV